MGLYQVTPGYVDLASLWDTLAFVNQITARLERRIAQIPKDAQIVIWGAGLHTELLFHKTSLFSEPHRRFLLVDGDPAKQDSRWRGLDYFRAWR